MHENTRRYDNSKLASSTQSRHHTHSLTLPHAVKPQGGPQRGFAVYRRLVAGRRGHSAPKAQRASDASSGPIRASATVTTNTNFFRFPALTVYRFGTARFTAISIPFYPINLLSPSSFHSPSPFLYLYLPLRYPQKPPCSNSSWRRLLCFAFSAASTPTNGANRAANRPLLGTPPPRPQTT